VPIQLEFICQDCKQMVRVKEGEKMPCGCAGTSWGVLPGVKVTRTEVEKVAKHRDPDRDRGLDLVSFPGEEVPFN